MSFHTASDPVPARQPHVPLPPDGRIDWRPILDKRGRYSALVTPGSSAERAARHCAGLAYIAAPYQREAQLRGAWRIERSARASLLAAREMALLAASGCTAICPAVAMAEMAHARVLAPDDAPDPLDAPFWAAWSQPILNVAALLIVPQIPGWDLCPQVWLDLRFALSRNMPVHVYGGGE